MKVQFQVVYDYMDQSNDDNLSEATMKEILRSSTSSSTTATTTTTDHQSLEGKKTLPVFDDFDLCQKLLDNDNKDDDDDVLSVEVDTIRLYHTSVCVMGLQAEYRVEKVQESSGGGVVVRLQKGRRHYFSKGIFRFYCGAYEQQDIVTLKVSRKESIIKVRPTRGNVQGKIVTVSHLLPSQTITLS